MHDPDGQGTMKDPSPVAPSPSEPQQPSPSTPQELPASRPQEPSLWPARIKAATTLSYEFVMRPRVRLSVTGAILLLIGTLLATNSVWTLPLVIVGALMIVIAWIGHRLEGRFAVEWGEAGTQLALRATVKPARAMDEAAPRRGALDAPSPWPAQSRSQAQSQSQPQSQPPERPEREQVIDGEAHTVEIDATELKALIDAVESIGAGAAPDPPAHDIRIRRMAWDASRASETAG
jgi:hypothetical protein